MILSDHEISELCTPPKFVVKTLVPVPTSGYDVYYRPNEVYSYSHLSDGELNELIRKDSMSDCGIKSYRELNENELADFKPMIKPFVPHQVRYRYNEDPSKNVMRLVDGVEQWDEKIISYGCSSYGYDVRIADEFKIFTNVNTTVVDPKDFNSKSFVDFTGDVVIIPPNSFLLARTKEYLHMPSDVTGLVLGKSTYARCFTGDTKVILADGTNPTFIELIDRFNNGEKLFGYSIDNNLKIVMSELTLPRKIGHEKIIEVILDNGESVRCTYDHKFITREGLEIQACDLQPGDSLFPLYKITNTNGYVSIAQPLTWTYDSAHKLADDWNIRNNIYKFKVEESARHHLDHNKFNNVPENIVRMTPSAHSTYHNNINKTNKDIQLKISVSHKKRWEDKSKDKMWLDQQLNHLKHMNTLFINDPEAKQRHVLKLREYWNSDKGLETREVLRQKMRVTASTDEFKQRSSESLKNLWADPEYREMMIGVIGQINLRSDVTETELINALESEGSIRGAARKLACDRSVFRRYRDVIANFKEKWLASKITADQFYEMMLKLGSATKAAKYFKIGRSAIQRHYKEAVNKFYGTTIEDNHKVLFVKELNITEDVYCLTAPEFGNFALDKGIFVNNCGVSCLATPIEAGWHGEIVLEFANTTPLPVKLYANEGAAQILFFKGNVNCKTSYEDRIGKYQGQTGITLAKV